MKRNSCTKEVVPIELKGCMKQYLMSIIKLWTLLILMNYTRKNVIRLTGKDMMKQKSIAMEIIYSILLMFHHVTLVSGRSAEPLYFVFVKEKELADKMLRDCFDHVINVGEQFFRDYYLKLVRS